MKYIGKMFLSFFLILFLLFSHISPSYSAVINNTVYVNITPDSKSDEIEGFQQLLAELNIYQGVIDGNFETFKKSIAIFQVNAGLIPSLESEVAGYIGPFTYGYLLKTYGNKFETLYKKYIGEPGKISLLTEGETYFVVTAYYSPIKGQKKYATGSYWGDIKLNGEGVRGASGARVHAGFIAAPKNYAFGTKIELDGLGVGVVQDRGGAIVNAGIRGHWYDRLDVWMGYGDTGLTRALHWGKRTVKGRFRKSSTKITMNFSTNIPLAQSYSNYTTKVTTTQVTTTKTPKTPTIVNPIIENKKGIHINPSSQKEDILHMQNLFIEAGIYTGKADGKYSSFKAPLITWQIQNKIIISRVSYGAGYVGKKTLALLEQKYPKVFLKEKDKIENLTDSDTQTKTGSIVTVVDSKVEVPDTSTKKSSIEEKDTISKKDTPIKPNASEKLILETYGVTLKEKEYVEGIYTSIKKIFTKKYGKNALKLKSKTSALIRKIDLIISKSTNPKLTGQLLYLKTLFK